MFYDEVKIKDYLTATERVSIAYEEKSIQIMSRRKKQADGLSCQGCEGW